MLDERGVFAGTPGLGGGRGDMGTVDCRLDGDGGGCCGDFGTWTPSVCKGSLGTLKVGLLGAAEASPISPLLLPRAIPLLLVHFHACSLP